MRVCRDITIQTLKRVDIEALVLPVKVFFLQCLFKCTSLGIVWSDNTVRNVFVLKVFCEKYYCFNLFLVLENACVSVKDVVGAGIAMLKSQSTTLTYKLFPSSSSCSIPFTSINRQAMVLDGTTWPASDWSRSLYTCRDINSPICGGIRSRELD